MAYLTSNGRRNYFMTFGAGRPLVLLHGISNSGRAWGAQIGPLAAAGFKVIVPDHAGHGASAPVRGHVTVETLASDVVALLDHLSIESADVVGLSLGGMVALQLALEAPQRVGRLVMANSYSTFKGEAVQAMVRTWADTFREPDGPTHRFENAWPLNASETFRQTAEGMQMYQMLHGLAAVADGESLAQVAEGVFGFDAEERLGRLKPNTLFIAGSLDTVSPPKLSQRMAEAVPHGQYVELPGAAHLSNVDSARAFNEVVLAFLSKAYER
ncbi:alpha/beta hydrolase [Burkholderia ubonensis]|uniref:alpha/beta fold hydrolase n=1 Tax=Burkholderia ubonensis TaxID=101571 RepID=UPI00075A1DEB|nr:alpha/beta fold hydrolase [Burkholderia ubonensis]KVN98168.1 alpha/beta hydrolase [Burkholderia ubonensis]